MVLFPNCKINLGLHITGKRNDGFHNLQTVFYPLNITDALEIIPNPNPGDEVDFSISGISIDSTAQNNICVKAYLLLKKKIPQLPAVKIHLLKAIPTGAGLGGGSADGAYTLLLLNKKFNLNLSNNQLVNYALELGSDCPFFIIGKACFAEGRGELLTEISLSLSGFKFCIVNPHIHINTGWAFTQIKPAIPVESIHSFIQQPIETWKSKLKNDFEQPVLAHYPQLGPIKEELYKQGAIYAAMSGSGSTFFGIFHQHQIISTGHWPKNYFVKEVPAT